MLDRHITQKFLNVLGSMTYGTLTVVMPDGRSYFFEGPKPSVDATFILKDWRTMRKVLTQGDIGFAQAYGDGWWESDNLTNLFILSLQNESVLVPYLYGSSLGAMVARMSYLFRRNTLAGSARNVQAHYDLGNDFYALWLDSTMTYSAGLFQGVETDLMGSQHRKYDRILEKLNESGSLLEIGCGWGGFAEHALQKKDYALKGITISKAQHSYASKRLGVNAHIALEDYRKQEGTYDHIVSIEMFEAVGEAFWPAYFQKIKALLNPKGKILVQTITMNETYFERYRRTGDMIRTYIFPGGMLPSVSRFQKESEKAGLAMVDRFHFGPDYAQTLHQWLVRFENSQEELKKLGFDAWFMKIWRFYLTCCSAAFTVGRTDVMQVELVHA